MTEYADQRAHDVAWMTAAEREALDRAAAHVYAEAQDDTYSHLVNAQCACGWRMSGYMRRELAWHFWRRHFA